MKFSIFPSVKSSSGSLCTAEKFWSVADERYIKEYCEDIAQEENADKRGDLKKQLPIITWQAYFEGKRVAKEAQPSGLFMLDIDHMEGDPYEFYKSKIAGHIKDYGIMVVHKTPSTHGLRIVAKCLPTLSSLEECQRWLAGNLKVEYDAVCKDFARSSFIVPSSYIYYIDGKVFTDEPAEGTVYAAGKNPVQVNAEFEQSLPAKTSDESEKTVDQREGLFGGSNDYKGVPYERIIKEWFYYTGGEPTEGERNTRLYQLALRLRYITDFNEATMLRVMPRYGLPESEIKEIVRHSLSTTRGQNIPKDMQDTLERIDRQIKIIGDNEDEEIPEIITSTEKIPSLPPVFRQWWDIAPDDFKKPVTLCQLPILGALGSRLRATYLDGKVHSPSFQVSLEAPQASGKSFLVRLVECELAHMMQSDEAQRELEKAYQEKVAEMKLLNIKINVDNKDEILGQKPKGIIRYLPATISITKMLQRMEAAQGLHCFSLSEEIDTVRKAYKKGFSNLSEMLRVAFDNGLYGQDYASDQSWSGNVALYYNTLFSGTPKAMCRFYPDVEDGLVSRVLFVTLPDQFGKPMPVWGTFTPEQQRIVDIGLTRLSEISLQGNEVQPEHMMRLNWLNKTLDLWIKAQQAEAVRENDRTRDTFCRRAAVVGFRAGMLAWYLWEEKNTPTIRKNVSNFAVWVANCMLNQHILRFNVSSTHSNVNRFESALGRLGDEFTRDEADRALQAEGYETDVRQVLYKWRLQGLIEPVERGRSEKGKKIIVKFKKIKK